MKHLVKIAGLCLASMLVMGMAIVGTASAAPHWLHCVEGTEGVAPTKYVSSQCSEAAKELKGKWQWNELTGTEKVVGGGTLDLRDTGAPFGGTEVQCSGRSEGVVGPKNLDKVTSVVASSCTVLKAGGCESLVGVAEPRNLPWQTEVFETEKTLRDKLTEDGKGQPGWAITCKTLLGNKTDTCLSVKGKETTTLLENRLTGGVLLVLSTFQKEKSGKAECSESSGSLDGEVEGSLGTAQANGSGLRVSS